MEEKKKLSKGKKTALIVSLCILGLILALLITGFVWGKTLLSKIGRLDGSEEPLSQEEIDSILNETDAFDPDDTAPTIDDSQVKNPNAELVEDGDNIVNILLVGQDRRPDQGKSRQRSDSMILCTINKQKKTLTMTSFMRDLWVMIPERYNERLNVPYAIGGFPLLNATMESQFGIRVDHNIEVDFAGFEDVIDALGGVEVTLTSAEAKYVSSAGKTVSAGTHVLNGAQALAYARIRKVGTEFARTNRQRTILNTIFTGFKDLSLKELYAVAEKILPLVRTDMTDSEIMGYILEFAPMLPQMQIISQRIPIDGAYQLTRIKGKSVIYLNDENWKKNLDFIKETIGG